MADRLLDVVSVATRYGLTRGEVRRLARAGLLPHVVLPNGEIRFEKAELSAWLEGQRRPARTFPGAESALREATGESAKKRGDANASN